MKKHNTCSPSRRQILKSAAAAALTSGIAGSLAASPIYLEPTPEVPDDDEPTPSQTEGPYFKTKSPERASLLEKDAKGTPLIVSGAVLFTDGKPVSKALIDVWHCDADGEYDNTGFKFRGHLFTDENGRFKLETIVPGVYPGRTRHIHVKVQAPEGRVLTTQLYFPDEPLNQRDGIFDKRLIMKLKEAGANASEGKAAGQKAKSGSFDFVLRR